MACEAKAMLVGRIFSLIIWEITLERRLDTGGRLAVEQLCYIPLSDSDNKSGVTQSDSTWINLPRFNVLTALIIILFEPGQNQINSPISDKDHSGVL